MMERDYARVLWWRGKTLGLMLVNRKKRNFFLHAETLVTLHKAKGEPKLVKRREQNADTITTRHPGDVVGRVSREIEGVVIELIFGEAERRVKIVRGTNEVENFIDRQTFIIPGEEFDKHLQSMELMLEQEKVFDALWTDSRAEIPQFYFVDEGEAGESE